MTTPPPLTPEMQTAFDNYPPPIRDQMLNVRKLAYEVAADTEGVGQLEETLKWRQISYLPSATKSGTTLRMDQDPANPSQVALYVHCQTNLIETFQGHYGDLFSYDSNRGLLCDLENPQVWEALKACIQMVFTYHLDKKQPR